MFPVPTMHSQNRGAQRKSNPQPKADREAARTHAQREARAWGAGLTE